MPCVNDTVRNWRPALRGNATRPLAVVRRPEGSTVRYTSRYVSTPYRTLLVSQAPPRSPFSVAVTRPADSTSSRSADTTLPRSGAAIAGCEPAIMPAAATPATSAFLLCFMIPS